MIRKYLKMAIPDRILVYMRTIQIFMKLTRDYVYDLIRYTRYSNTCNRLDSFHKLEAGIVAHYHVIEKGLSLPEPRPGFGKDVASSLIDLLIIYRDRGYPPDDIQYLSAIATLENYTRFHKQNNFDISNIELKIKGIAVTHKLPVAGAITVFRKDILAASRAEFELFSKGRHSVRNYDRRPVSVELIRNAIRIAQNAPSVCNRQSSRVYIISDMNVAKNILSLQNGNRGFGHIADKILIVTSDLQVFEGATERNQAFIDGGIFAMSLLYALHYYGLGACALNWSVSSLQDRRLRKAVRVKDSENIIMMVAVGHLPDNFKVAVSNRKKPDDIIEVI